MWFCADVGNMCVRQSIGCGGRGKGVSVVCADMHIVINGQSMNECVDVVRVRVRVRVRVHVCACDAD